MIWDSADRRYEDENGRPLTPAQIRKHIEEYIQTEKEKVKRESSRLFEREISVTEFFAFMRRQVTAWHSTAGVIAYGGKGEM